MDMDIPISVILRLSASAVPALTMPINKKYLHTSPGSLVWLLGNDVSTHPHEFWEGGEKVYFEPFISFFVSVFLKCERFSFIINEI